MTDAERHRDGIVVSGIATPIKQAVLQAVMETIGLGNMTAEDFQFLAHIDNWGHALIARYNAEVLGSEKLMDELRRGTYTPGPPPQEIPVKPAWPGAGSVGTQPEPETLFPGQPFPTRQTSPGLATLPEDATSPGLGAAEDQAPGVLSPPAPDNTPAPGPEAAALATTWKPGDPEALFTPAEGEVLLPSDAPNYEDLTHGMREDYATGMSGNLKG